MRLELNLEIVTPLFLGGADPNQSELRPASVRGALRYWLRAAHGATLNASRTLLEELATQESAVFGATDSASPVIVRLGGVAHPMATFALDKNKQGQQLRTGHNYLYYSTRLNPNNRMPFAPHSNPQAALKLTLHSRSGLAADAACASLHQAGLAVWLLTHLGGLGTRARRCGGSLQTKAAPITDDAEVKLPDFAFNAATPDELHAALANGLGAIKTFMGHATRPTQTFDVLHPDLCRIWVIAHDPACQAWKDAVEITGSKMQSFRAAQGPNRNQDNAIFGVPILHGPTHGLQRRASPLWLRITRLANGEYVTVATLFKADFKAGTSTVGGGYALIEQFINTLGGKEVNYK